VCALVFQTDWGSLQELQLLISTTRCLPPKRLTPGHKKSVAWDAMEQTGCMCCVN
jgi:hypothetical protein